VDIVRAAPGFGRQAHRKEPPHRHRREDMIFVSKFSDGLNFQVSESDGYGATTGHVSSSRLLPWYLWRTNIAANFASVRMLIR
jgi:hypothetical protein